MSHWMTTNVVKINPKALDVTALFGETNEATNEWRDGIIGIVRKRRRRDKHFKRRDEL